MPHCPGCQRDVPYEQLDAHLARCGALVDDDDESHHEALRRLDRRVVELEVEVDRHLGQLEDKLDRMLRQTESRRPTEVTRPE